MAKRKVFTPELQRYMRNAGYDWRYFELINDLSQSMLVKDKQTNQVILVSKKQGQQGIV